MEGPHPIGDSGGQRGQGAEYWRWGAGDPWRHLGRQARPKMSLRQTPDTPAPSLCSGPPCPPRRSRGTQVVLGTGGWPWVSGLPALCSPRMRTGTWTSGDIAGCLPLALGFAGPNRKGAVPGPLLTRLKPLLCHLLAA